MMIRRALPADVDLLALHRANPARYPLLLESVAGGNALSRWDLLFITDGDGLRLASDGVTRRLDGRAVAGDFLSALDDEWRALASMDSETSLPFRGGWALYLSYELAAQVEPVLYLPPANGPLPVALALRCPAALLRDRLSGECVAIAEAGARAVATADTGTRGRGRKIPRGRRESTFVFARRRRVPGQPVARMDRDLRAIARAGGVVSPAA